jgi:hypothetical protein
MSKGVLDGCRRVIGLDGCFLKGLMKGELLSSIGKDANNHIYQLHGLLWNMRIKIHGISLLGIFKKISISQLVLKAGYSL